jgi:hypothetical protein
MAEEKRLKEMVEKIRLLHKTATELKQMSGGIQTIDRNLDRILVGIKILELSVSDVLDVNC